MEPGRGMNPLALGAVAALILAGGAAVALQNETAAPPVSTEAPAEPPAEAGNASAPAEGAAAPAARRGAAAPAFSRAATPMNQRVAVIGLLNKRNGLWRDLTMRPGQAFRVGDVIVRLRACETTAPWETQKLTGAFVQVDVAGVDDKWRRVFSGWLYKESPSLNVVEHPIYDVWPKSCTMTHPEIGPATVRPSAGAAGGASRSSAPKSGPAPEPSPAPAEPSPSANAAPSNAT
jgi:hypothetical protein